MADLIARSIQYHSTFWEHAAELGLDEQWVDSRLIGLTFIMARTPEVFESVNGTNFRMARYDGAPPLKIWFTHDEQVILLLGMTVDYRNLQT